MDDHFGVRVGAEPVPPRLELGSQLSVIVDLAVEHDPYAAVFVGDRLMAAGDVDDAQATDPQDRRGIDMDPVIVRPAVAQRLRHGVHPLGGLRRQLS